MQDGDTPLLLAAQTGHTEVAAALLAAGANKDAANKVGYRRPVTAMSIGVCVYLRYYLAQSPGQQ